jgi:ribosomal protein S27E
MRAVSSGSTGFAVLRREANEGGYFRPIVKEVVERYLDCGNPKCGFALIRPGSLGSRRTSKARKAHGGLRNAARIRCPDCAEERLVMFSCRTRGFCPSCHAKRVEEWGEWMRETLLLDVPLERESAASPKKQILIPYRCY